MKDGVILRVSKPARMGIDDASLYPLQPCLPRGLRSALLRKASVLRNRLLRKWDARQPSSAFSRSPLMLQSRVLLHCCVLRTLRGTSASTMSRARSPNFSDTPSSGSIEVRVTPFLAVVFG